MVNMFIQSDNIEWRTFCFSTVEDVLQDIPESLHKHFIKRYLNDWPNPHLTYYKVGQTVNIELDGAQQKCKVQVVDCSLMQVIFQVSVM